MKKTTSLFVDSACPLTLLGLEKHLSCEKEIRVIRSFEKLCDSATETSLPTSNSAVLLVAAEVYNLEEHSLNLLSQAAESEIKILFFSESICEEHIWKAVSLGANGYLPRNSLPTLVPSIFNVARGVNHFPHIVSKQLEKRSSRKALSKREREILGFVCQGLTNEQIGKILNVTAPTIKFHVSNLLTKMNAQNRTDAATEAFKRGIVSVSLP